eukprot:TRINITY_DN2901_c0_g1_i1.p1 TRINITY_DN2901_c0_g1~~TRINITY_DN2901_c0_g1_i1.p1  ORF type:complete len:120 (+),score=24.61 TRINITY_DN2901_c0_g1_i1:171-530(+)
MMFARNYRSVTNLKNSLCLKNKIKRGGSSCYIGGSLNNNNDNFLSSNNCTSLNVNSFLSKNNISKINLEHTSKISLKKNIYNNLSTDLILMSKAEAIVNKSSFDIIDINYSCMEDDDGT